MKTNILWIMGNVIFDLETGKTTQVLMFANRIEDATTFSEQDVHNIFNFVKQRTTALGKIDFTMEPSQLVKGEYVIKGVQVV